MLQSTTNIGGPIIFATLSSLEDAVKPVETLVDQLVGPMIGIVSTVAVIYCIFLGVKLATAEEPQDREKAKGALKNAIVGYFLIFVLIMMLRIISPVLTEWISKTADAPASSAQVNQTVQVQYNL